MRTIKYLTALRGARAAVTAVIAIIAVWRLSGERLPVRTVTTAEGLPRDQLACVRSDARGFIWFCTAEGLVRFDGHVAMTFGRNEGLNPPGVRSFLNASGERYFVGADEGLFAFDPRPVAGRKRFAVVARTDGQRVLGVNALVESRDHTIWCGTGGGLLHLSQTDGRPRLVEVEIGLPREVENDQIVHAVLEDERGTVWVGAGSGLYARHPDGRVTRVTVAEGLPANDILNLALDADRRLWAATRAGLVLLDRDAIHQRQAHVVRRIFTERDGLPSRNVRAIHVEGHTLWLATVFGIAEASITSAGDLKVDRTLAGFFAWDVTTDLRGDLWVATEAGARRLLRQGFTTYSIEDGLVVDRIASLFESASGEVCATYVGWAPRLEVSCFDDGRFERVPIGGADAIRYLGFGWSQLTLQDRQGGWWIPTGEGLLRFAPGPVTSLSTARPISTYTRRQGLRSDSIFRLFEDSRDGIWVATFAEDANGLARIDLSTGRVRVFGSNDGFANDLPYALAFAEDRSGAIWIGFNEGRLLRYRHRFEEIPLQHRQPGQRFPTYEAVGSILADRRGRVWIASSAQGLGRIDNPRADVPTIKWYGNSHGLSSDTAWMLVEDSSGNLFVGTGRGIDRFDPAAERFTHYSADEGVPRGEIWGGLRDRSGRIWFATTDGVARFDTRGEDPRPQPTILITAVRVAGIPLPTRADGNRRMGTFTVQPGDRRIEIDFVSPGARAADGARYQHRLDGVDRDWTTTDARTVALAGAAPGTYRFLVRSVFANGVVTDPATVEFIVLAPLWRRGWFVAIVAAAICVVAFVFHRSRVRHAIAVERVRSQIAADLHDGVGASLSRIAILSEVVRQQAQAALPDAIPALSAIAHNAREVIDDMSDAVWFIDPRLDNLQQVVTRTRAMASELFDRQPIEWTVDGPDDASHIALTSEQRRNVYLILKESLTNVLRHAQATRVDVQITAARGRLRVEVTDNGVGLNGPDATRHTSPRSGRGLENIRRRAVALGGTVSIVARDLGPGTSVIVDLPMVRPHDHAVGQIGSRR